MVETREAQSTDELLRRIPQYEVNKDPETGQGCPLFKRQHLKDKVFFVIGILGQPGAGKSGSGSAIALIEDMLEGRRVYSNVHIKADYKISDELAWNYGLPYGGQATFESLPLNREKLLRFDPNFFDCSVFIDGINLEFAEARRAMSNVNLWFNEVDQQHRKLHMPIYYTVINEMWVDDRLRSLTDIFIMCEDPAITVQGLKNRVEPGLQTEWTIYDMHGYLTGKPFLKFPRPLAPRYLQLKRFWDIWETDRKEKDSAAVSYSLKLKDMELEGKVSVQQDKTLKELEDEWGDFEQALTDIIQRYQESGKTEIPRLDLFEQLGVTRAERLKVGTELKNRLKIRESHGNMFYQIPQANLSVPESMRSRQPVGAVGGGGAI